MALAAMVLCAGLGTRLRPLTDLRPKPAVPVLGVPLIRYALGQLARAGVRRAVVNVHHLPEVMAVAARAAADELGLSLAVSREPVIAGTGGALREARAHLAGAETILLLNGDVLFDADLAALLSAHRASGALATMALLPMPPGARYATVELDEGGRVRRIAGRFGPGGDRLTPWHFPGLHALSPGLLERILASPYACDVNRDLYPPLMARGLVRGLVTRGAWSDLGDPASYLAANLAAAAGGLPLSRFGLAAPPPRIALDARIDPAAHVDDQSVVGSRCEVPAGAWVERSVLWEGTSLDPGERLAGVVAAGALRVPALVAPGGDAMPGSAPARR